MAPGSADPLFILAIDRRAGLAADLLGTAAAHAPDARDRLVDAKTVIAEGFELAVAAGVPRGAGLLVDEQYGAEIARQARTRGELLAMPVERAGLDWFEFEYGTEFATHIESFDPPFVKALVHYNPDGDPANNQRSIEALATLSRWLRDHHRRLLLELIVPPTPAQLERAGGIDAYDREFRPDLMRRAVAWIQAASIEADVWKLEGLDRRHDAEMLAAQVRAMGRDHVGYVVLGRGAPEPRVDHWLRTSAGVPGCWGFAIGRSIWRDPVVGYLGGRHGREATASAIAQNYLRAIEVFTG